MDSGLLHDKWSPTWSHKGLRSQPPMPEGFFYASVSNMLAIKTGDDLSIEKNVWICWAPIILRCFGVTWRLRSHRVARPGECLCVRGNLERHSLRKNTSNLKVWNTKEWWKLGNGIIQQFGDIPIQEILLYYSLLETWRIWVTSCPFKVGMNLC